MLYNDLDSWLRRKQSKPVQLYLPALGMTLGKAKDLQVQFFVNRV